MHKSYKLLLCVLLLSLAAAGPAEALKVGDKLPTFTLQGLDEKTYKAEDFKGMVLVLFFLGYNCPVCLVSGPRVELEIWQPYKDKNLQVLGLDMWGGSQAQLSQFKSTTGVTFPLLLKAQNNFGISTSPVVDAMMVVDAEGVIQHIGGSSNLYRASVVKAVEKLLTPPAPAIRANLFSLDFGQELQVGQSKTVTFELRNEGDADLTITDIQTDLGAISLSATELTLPPGGKQEVQVTLTPTEGGVLSGKLTILSNDEALGPLEIAIREVNVIALPGAIALDVNVLDFGSVELRRAAEQILTVRNEGEGPLKVTDIRSDIPGLTLSRKAFEVPPGGSFDLKVSIAPSAEGEIAGTLTIVSNDPERGDFTLSLTGKGVVIFADARADFTGDGQINLADFIAFARAFNTAEAAFDLNGSGRVDFGDFVIFAQNFGRPLP